MVIGIGMVIGVVMMTVVMMVVVTMVVMVSVLILNTPSQPAQAIVADPTPQEGLYAIESANCLKLLCVSFIKHLLPSQPRFSWCELHPLISCVPDAL